MLDPRFTAILAAAGAAAGTLLPGRATSAATLVSTLLQAANDLQTNALEGNVTDADLAELVDKIGENLAGAKTEAGLPSA